MDIQCTIGDYKSIRVLGEGRYATVFEGLNMNDQRKVAIKVTSKSLIKGTNPHFIENERKVYHNLKKMTGKCPNILHFYDFLEEYDNAFFILEFFDGYTLQRVIFECIHHKNSQMISYEEKKNYLSQIGSALQFLHDLDIFHCDLKPENILIHRNKVKICDFGCAIISKTGTSSSRKLSFSGTPGYSPPEVYEKTVESVFLVNVDTWAYTCVLYFIFSGKQPFAKQTLYRTIQNLRECDVNYTGFSDQIRTLCESVFKIDPSSRSNLKHIATKISKLNCNQ